MGKAFCSLVAMVALSGLALAGGGKGVRQAWTYELGSFAGNTENVYVTDLKCDGQGGCAFVAYNGAQDKYMIVWLGKKGAELYRKTLDSSVVDLNYNSLNLLAVGPKNLVYTYINLNAESKYKVVRVQVDSKGVETSADAAGVGSYNKTGYVFNGRTDDSKGYFEFHYEMAVNRDQPRTLVRYDY